MLFPRTWSLRQVCFLLQHQGKQLFFLDSWWGFNIKDKASFLFAETQANFIVPLSLGRKKVFVNLWPLTFTPSYFSTYLCILLDHMHVFKLPRILSGSNNRIYKCHKTCPATASYCQHHPTLTVPKLLLINNLRFV